MNIFEAIEIGLREDWTIGDLMEMYDLWAANKNSSFSNHCGFFCFEVMVQNGLF